MVDAGRGADSDEDGRARTRWCDADSHVPEQARGIQPVDAGRAEIGRVGCHCRSRRREVVDAGGDVARVPLVAVGPDADPACAEQDQRDQDEARPIESLPMQPSVDRELLLASGSCLRSILPVGDTWLWLMRDTSFDR